LYLYGREVYPALEAGSPSLPAVGGRRQNVRWTFLALGRVGALGIIKFYQKIQAAFLVCTGLGKIFMQSFG